jgi:hypothetical protein
MYVKPVLSSLENWEILLSLGDSMYILEELKQTWSKELNGIKNETRNAFGISITY